VSAPEARALDVEHDWRSILDNEHNLNHVPLAGKIVDRVVHGLNESKTKKDWPGEQGLMWLRLASRIPLDMITRSQREAVMSVLTASQSDKKEKGSISPESFKLILSLMTKVMSRPTFYKDMHFQHLVDAADAASNIVITSELDAEHVQEMIERYSDFAFNTVRAMAGDSERCTTYFTESASFNAQADDAIQKRDAAESPPALRMTLLKALITGLSGSASSSKNQVIVSLLETAKQNLGQSIVIVLEEWASDEKFFHRPEPAGDLRLLAAVDAAQADTAIPVSISSKSSRRSLDTRSQMALEAGDMRGWKLQTLLRRHMPSKLQIARPASFPSLDALPPRIRDSVLKDYVTSVIEGMDSDSKMDYLKALIDSYAEGSDTDGQLLAVECVVDQLIGKSITGPILNLT
jgi:nucleolar pre-ribosomal-associated protein 2